MNNLGIELSQIIFYIISFVIAMWVLNNFVFRPVAKIMQEREDAINDSLALKSQVEDDVAHAEQKAQEIIKTAQDKAQAIIDQAQVDLIPEKERLQAQAETHAQEIIDKAHIRAEEITTNAQTQVNHEAQIVVRKILDKAINNLGVQIENKEMLMDSIIHKL